MASSRTDAPPARGHLRSPLGRRLAVSIILVSSVIALLMTAIQLSWTYNSEVAAVEEDLNQIKQVHLKSVAQTLWAANRNELKILLEGLAQIPSIEYVAVLDDAEKWGEAGSMKSVSVIQRDYPLHYRFRGEDRLIGHLTVVANLDQVYRYVFVQGLIILASNTLKTFLVAGFMLWIFYHQINRHLAMITDHLAKLDISTDPLPLQLQRESHGKADEFDILVAAVNRMQAAARRSHAALHESKMKFHAIADFTIDWESWLDDSGKLVWVNPSVTRMTGYLPEECYAMKDYPLPMLVDADERRRLQQAMLHSRVAENIECRIRHKDGVERWLAMSWQPVRGEQGEFMGLRCSARDIAPMKAIEKALEQKVIALQQADSANIDLLKQTRQEKARMVALLAAMNIGVLLEDVNRRVVYFNPGFRRIWLIPDHLELTGLPSQQVLEHSSNLLARPDHFSRHIMQVVGTHAVSDSFEIEMADGRVVTQASHPVHDEAGLLIGRLWAYEDVTHERQTAAQLIYLAERDSLTGLFNRHRFQDEMNRMLSSATRRDAVGALLFFDLDEFKYINDTFGHRTGDSILIRMAGEIGTLVRANEVLARLGGDEFALLLPDADEAAAIKLAERIVRSVSQIPFSFEGKNLRMTASLGIALYPQHGENAEDLVAHADTAMYQAKEAGKNGWSVYREGEQRTQEMLSRLTWNERIANAIDNDLLELHFQGIYAAKDLELQHLEALVRMRDADDPSLLIMPMHFIPLAEKTGKILDIDRWVLQTCVSLLAEQPELPAIAVNISGRSFDDPQLPRYITDLLQRFKVAPARLMVELTETSAVGDLHDAQRFIESLQQTGCQVCLDDFGTGFSSFSYLKHLQADILKIDGIFIRDLDKDRANQIFVKSIVDVARGLNKITVAEFVESESILSLLRQFGVDLVQGYHLDTPRRDHPALNGKAGTERV